MIKNYIGNTIVVHPENVQDAEALSNLLVEGKVGVLEASDIEELKENCGLTSKATNLMKRVIFVINDQKEPETELSSVIVSSFTRNSE